MKNLKPFLSAFMLTATSLMFANPGGFQTLVGDASMSLPDVNTVEVTTGKQAIIQWDSFSIEPSETTRFIMPDSKSVVLNRVLGGELSEILGTLEANGKIFLINPKGVFVGENAKVNTASFIASSYDVLNDEFIKSGNIAFKGESGSVTNLGKITAFEGDVILIGLQVANMGAIEAVHGTVGLAAGKEIFLQPSNNEKILIRTQLSEIVTDVGVVNEGLIQAIQTELKADGNLYSYAIKDHGKIDALTKCRRFDNKIYLVADHGKIETAGELIAPHGEVHILGNEIAVLEGAHINVNSDKGGGNVIIGSDYRDTQSTNQNASFVSISENALIEADALMEGDGGKVIVWGDYLNNFFGTITARGGSLEGNGGFVELSSKGLIFPMGNINTLAANGITGTLLLDPTAVIIDAPPATENGFAVVPSCPTMVNPVSFNFTGNASSLIYASRIQSLLTCTSVIVNASATGTAANGSITVSSPITWSTTNTLTFVADDASSFIDIQANIVGLNGTFNVTANDVTVGHLTGSLTHSVNVNVKNVTINADGDLNIHGSNSSSSFSQISGANINLNIGGDLNIHGGNGIASYAAIKSNGSIATPGALAALVTGNVILTAGDGTSSSAAITASNGSISLGSSMMMAPVASVQLIASDIASYANAYIATYTSGGIDIFSTGEVILDAGLQPGANANIFTQGSDNYDAHINITTASGDVKLLGGGAS